MSFEDLFLTSVGDTGLLPLVLEAAATYEEAPERSEMDEMRSRLNMTIPGQKQWPRLWDK